MADYFSSVTAVNHDQMFVTYPPVAGILWDLDGTLVDSSPDLTIAVGAARAVDGLPALSVSAVLGMVGDGAEALLARALAPLPVTGAHRAAFHETYARVCAQQTRAYPGIVEVVNTLTRRGIVQGIVTNKPLAFVAPILAAQGLSFAVVVGGDGPRKPDPAPVRLALTRLGLTGAQTWMVGDHHTDMLAGRGAGCRTAFCRWGFGHPGDTTPDRILELPSVVLDLLT